MPKQDHHVLNGCRQVLLDLNPPEPPPAGPLEAVPRRSGEGSLHEMLPGPDILSKRRGSGSIPHPVQSVLTKMTLDRAARLCRRALASELTGVADAASAQIIHGLLLHVMPSRFDLLSRRVSVAVGLRVIPEGLRREDPLASPRVVLASLDVRDMGPQTPIMTGQVVIDRSVFGVRHHDLGRLLRVAAVLFNQGQ
jgi:hypothetical protein